MQVSIVVCTYNRARSLGATLEALGGQVIPDALRCEIVVVDNNSRDATARVVAALGDTARIPIRYVFEPEQGLSRARNRGVREARGAIIAFTDDDVLPAPDWIAQLVEAFDRWNAHGVGGRILPRWEAPPPAWLVDNEHLLSRLSIMDFAASQLLSLPLRRRPQVWGANVAFRRGVFDRVGDFDPRRGIIGDRLFRGEEIDLVTRGLERGLRIAYDAAPMVFHRIGADRMQKRYFRRVAFDDAECGIRLGGARAAGKSFRGAPLWMYRAVCVDFLAMLPHVLLGWPGAFDRELAWVASVGRLSGYWKTRRGRPARS